MIFMKEVKDMTSLEKFVCHNCGKIFEKKSEFVAYPNQAILSMKDPTPLRSANKEPVVHKIAFFCDTCFRKLSKKR
jgi:hypothetical protein